jgi:hypothetical protein
MVTAVKDFTLARIVPPDDMIVFPTAKRIALETGAILALGFAGCKPLSYSGASATRCSATAAASARTAWENSKPP